MRWVIKIVEDMAENEGIRLLKFSNRKNESVLFHDNDLVTGVSENEVEDYDIDQNTTINEVCPDSEDEWDEDEVQETISDMKSDHVVMNENDGVQDKDKTDELEESGDDLDEIVPSEKINDEVAEVVAFAPRTTRSGKSYAQVVQRGIE